MYKRISKLIPGYMVEYCYAVVEVNEMPVDQVSCDGFTFDQLANGMHGAELVVKVKKVPSCDVLIDCWGTGWGD